MKILRNRILVLLALASIWLIFAAPAEAQSSRLKIGVGMDYPSQLPSFEQGIKYKTDIFLVYQNIREDFYLDALTPVAQSGHIIQLSWEPWDPFSASGANQPAYKLTNITRGDFDGDIRRWAQQLRDFGYPVRLRPMCEMNGNWTSWSGGVNGNSPADYIPAWRHIHDIFVQQGATNVKWVWSPNRDGSIADATNTFNQYYPGDAYVDYIGMNGYNWGTMMNSWSWLSTWQSFSEVFGYSYDVFASRSSKPLMISETSSTEVGGSKAAWIGDAFAQLPARFPRIESLTWFEYLKETDWRVGSSTPSLAAFRAAVGALDTGPPTVSFNAPSGGATLSGTQTISVNATDDNAVSRVDLYAGDSIVGSGSAAPYNFYLNTRSLAEGPCALTAVAYDYTGKANTYLINVNISNPGDRDYYFNWYDSGTPGMTTWLIIGNPGGASQHAEVYLGGGLAGSFDVPPGSRATPVFPGAVTGPVKVVCTTGGNLLVSERSLYNGNFTELAASPQTSLDNTSYLSWYDERSPGMRTWVMVENQTNGGAEVDIEIAGVPAGHFYIPARGVIAPEFQGVMGGPVKITSTGGQLLSVSERTTYMGSFNEISSQPESNLAPEYYFSWYDAGSPGMRTWAIIDNLGSQATNAGVYIGGQLAGTYYLPPGGSAAPLYPGLMNGPMRVVSDNGQPLFSSLRSIYGNSMEEAAGASPSSLAPSQWFGWYDCRTSGMADWIVVGNPNNQQANVEIRIHGALAGRYTIPAGGRITPIYPGAMDGPVEVRETGGLDLQVSQRVTYNGSFNELTGSVLQ